MPRQCLFNGMRQQLKGGISIMVRSYRLNCLAWKPKSNMQTDARNILSHRNKQPNIQANAF